MHISYDLAAACTRAPPVSCVPPLYGAVVALGTVVDRLVAFSPLLTCVPVAVCCQLLSFACSLHICITLQHIDTVDQFLQDLQSAVTTVRTARPCVLRSPHLPHNFSSTHPRCHLPVLDSVHWCSWCIMSFSLLSFSWLHK